MLATPSIIVCEESNRHSSAARLFLANVVVDDRNACKMNQIEWEQTDSPSAADIAQVDDGLESSNRARADLENVRPLACFARLPSGELIGGAIARTWGGCCELRQLWVAPPHRRRGIGRHLVEMVKQEAVARGCTLLYLETFSFQIPQLYRSIGFETVCAFQGFPDGVVKYVMQKRIGSQARGDSSSLL
jgi:GNAT superfamily N-acetyltransferase